MAICRHGWQPERKHKANTMQTNKPNIPAPARCRAAVEVLTQMAKYMKARGCKEQAQNYEYMASDLEDDLRAAQHHRPADIEPEAEAEA